MLQMKVRTALLEFSMLLLLAIYPSFAVHQIENGRLLEERVCAKVVNKQVPSDACVHAQRQTFDADPVSERIDDPAAVSAFEEEVVEAGMEEVK